MGSRSHSIENLIEKRVPIFIFIKKYYVYFLKIRKTGTRSEYGHFSNKTGTKIGTGTGTHQCKHILQLFSLQNVID